jgi:maltose alpha-D-glucosyltransferase/alpha-amylase
VLVVQNDVAIIDFEGEPTRPLAERTAKSSPLRDVAGMLRSFDYALWTTIFHRLHLGADPQATINAVEGWRADTQGAFLAAYREGMAGGSLLPEDPAAEARLLELFLIQKVAYEIGYELSMRPDWVQIPLEGLLALLDDGAPT